MNYLADIPYEAEKALSLIQKLLAKSLIAVYLHGSAATNSLRPRSDIDLLVIVDQPITYEIRKSLLDNLMMISGQYPADPLGRRPLEVIIFLCTDLVTSAYPARSEFMYGEWLRNEYEAGKIPEPVCDPELTLVLAQAKQEAIPLFGPNADALIPAISKADIHQAIKDCLPTLIESLQGDERNVLLTLARMWRTLATDEFVSKNAAADWAITRLPAEQAATLVKAKESYLKGHEVNWQNHQHQLLITVNSLRDRILTNL